MLRTLPRLAIRTGTTSVNILGETPSAHASRRSDNWPATKRTKKHKFRAMLADRPDFKDFSRSPVRAGCLIERLPIVQAGGCHGNPLLPSADGNPSNTTADDLTHFKWSRVQELKDARGKVYPSSLGISDHSVLPPTADGVDRVQRHVEMLPDFMIDSYKTMAESLHYPPSHVKRHMTSRCYLLVKPKGEEKWEFPMSGVVEEAQSDSPVPDLRRVSENVIANLVSARLKNES